MFLHSPTFKDIYCDSTQQEVAVYRYIGEYKYCRRQIGIVLLCVKIVGLTLPDIAILFSATIYQYRILVKMPIGCYYTHR